MKDIEFRAWDENDKCMLDWENIKEQWESEGFSDNMFRNDHYDMTQYTGIKDKNGVKIFEGDIVKAWMVLEYGEEYLKDKYEIFYDTGEGIYSIKNNTENFSPNNIGSFILEVIGNIHENPELLKG